MPFQLMQCTKLWWKWHTWITTQTDTESLAYYKSLLMASMTHASWIPTVNCYGISHPKVLSVSMTQQLQALLSVIMFVCLVFNDTFSTNRLYRAIGVWNIYCVGLGEIYSNINKPNKRKIHRNTGLCGDNLLTSWRCHQRGLSIANHLASTDN